MTQSLSMHPEPSWLGVMREAYTRARYSEAAAIYDASAGNAPPFDARLLRSRVHLKRNSPSVAVDLLLERKPDGESRASRMLWELYLGIAFSRMREFAVADQHFAEADHLAESAGERAENAYHRARRFLLESRRDDAWNAYQATYEDITPEGAIRSETLRGFILGFAQDYAGQAESLVRAIDLMNHDRAANLEEWYCSIQTLAVLARERHDPAALHVALREAARPEEWSPDFYVHRFQSLRALGWCKALAGDSLGCFRLLRDAQTLAESVAGGEAWRTIILLDRTHFAKLAGESHWASNELAAAQDLARRISWEHSTGEERIALLLFAELLVEREPEQAQLFLARFNTLNDLRSPLLYFSFDDRLQALANSARGMVHLATGNLAEAEKCLKSAWSTFDRIGYDWRAGKAAMGLARATGKARWRLLAAEKLEAYRASWLFEELKTSDSNTEQPTLTPMQQRILDLLCSGLSTDAISDRLQRSPNTVRNHLKLLFKAYGVKTRAALVSKALSHAK